MKNLLNLLILTLVVLGCDAPDTPDYSISIKTGETEYYLGDTITVYLQNKTKKSIYLSFADSAAMVPDFILEQKTNQNWKQAGTLVSGPVTFTKEIVADSTVRYQFKVPFSSIPENGVNIFRVNHRIFLEGNQSRSAGEQQTTSNPFFILE